jgi:hypothetical protein
VVVDGPTNLNIALSHFAGFTALHSAAGSLENCGESVNTCVDTNWDVTLNSLLASASGPLQPKVGEFVDTNPSTNPSTATASTGTLTTRVDVNDYFLDTSSWSGEDYSLSGPTITLGPGQAYTVSATGLQNCHTGFVELDEESGSALLRINFDATWPRDCNLG